MQSNLYITTQAERCIKRFLIIWQSHDASLLVIQIKSHFVVRYIQQHSDNRSDIDPTIPAIGMFIVMAKPTATAVNVHAPRLVVFTQNGILDSATQGHTYCGIWVSIIPINGDFPIVAATRETDVTEHNSVVKAGTGCGCIVIGQDNVGMSSCWIQCKPSNCNRIQQIVNMPSILSVLGN